MSEADRFDQVSEHLRLRGVAMFCRGVIATICTVLCLTVLVTVFSETGPRSTFQIACAVAAAMRRGFDDSALIGRIGGEEFAVAGNWCPPELDRQTRALCTAIAALPWGVSASIGTIRARTDATRGDVDSFIDHLISAADGAMYTAKRSGGNQVHHLPLDSPPDV